MTSPEGQSPQESTFTSDTVIGGLDEFEELGAGIWLVSPTESTLADIGISREQYDNLVKARIDKLSADELSEDTLRAANNVREYLESDSALTGSEEEEEEEEEEEQS